MSAGFRAGAQELADEVAHLYRADPHLSAADIGARARRARRRREAVAVGASGAVLAVLVLGGAALLERDTAAPPAGEPTELPTMQPEETPTVGPDGTTTAAPTDPSVDPQPEPGSVGPGAVESLVVDPAEVGRAIAGLGDLRAVDAGLQWGLVPEAAVLPDERCRPAITVVPDAPPHFEARMWASESGQVVQEFVLLDDAEQAAEAFEVLGAALRGCPEYGAEVPGTSSAWHVVEDLTEGTGALPSLLVVGTESGEGSVNTVVRVDVLVGNAIVRTEVVRYGEPDPAPAATPAEAAALDEVVQRALDAR